MHFKYIMFSTFFIAKKVEQNSDSYRELGLWNPLLKNYETVFSTNGLGLHKVVGSSKGIWRQTARSSCRPSHKTVSCFSAKWFQCPSLTFNFIGYWGFRRSCMMRLRKQLNVSVFICDIRGYLFLFKSTSVSLEGWHYYKEWLNIRE